MTTAHTLTDADLVRHAVESAGHHGNRPRPRWAYVADTFCLGSTSAAALCRRFGLDPDEMLGAWSGEEWP